MSFIFYLKELHNLCFHFKTLFRLFLGWIILICGLIWITIIYRQFHLFLFLLSYTFPILSRQAAFFSLPSLLFLHYSGITLPFVPKFRVCLYFNLHNCKWHEISHKPICSYFLIPYYSSQVPTSFDPLTLFLPLLPLTLSLLSLFPHSIPLSPSLI